MNNWDIATQATETSINSQNSAMFEQQKFAESLEGRINRLDTAWNKFVLSSGEAVITDGLVAGIEALNGLATVSATVIDKFGLLSGVFATLGVAVFTLSTRFRIFATAVMTGTGSMATATLTTAGLSAGMTRLQVAMVGAKVAMRGLLLASGVGIAFAALGYVVEKLVGHFADAKRSAEEFDQQQQMNIDALTTNKEATDNLLASYEALTRKKEDGKAWSTDDEKEYLQVQNQLAQTFPNLLQYYDASGQAHLKSSEAIQAEIDKTNALIEAKKRETRESALANFDDMVGSRDKSFNQFEKKTSHADNIEKDYKDTERVRKQVADLRREASQANTEYVAQSQKIASEVLKVAETYNKVEIDSNISNQIDSLVSSLNTQDLDASQFESLAINIAKYEDAMQKAYETNNQANFDKAKQGLTSYLSELGFTDKEIGDFDISIKSLTDSERLMADATYDGEESIDGLGDAAAQAADNIEKLKNASEVLAGTTQDEVDALISAVNVYRLLNDAENLSAQQKDILAAATEMLSDKYPHLINNGEFRIEQMEREAEQEAILLKATEMLANGQLTAEEQMTLAMVMHTKARLKILADQVRMYEQAAQRYADIAMQESQAGNAGDSDQAFLEASKNYKRAQSLQSNLADEIEASMPDMDKHMQDLANATNYHGRYYDAVDKSTGATKDNTDATKKNNEETENSVYITDKYKQKLSELNAELQKVNRLKSQYPEYSKKYRDALQKEINLQKEALELNRQQQRDLSAQIKSGNIQPKGIVTTSDKDSKGVASQLLNDYRITSKFGANESFRSSGHGGVDFANGKQGDPVKALKAGKVTQAYYSKSGGYMVVVQQDDGIVTKYMHMQKGLKVKAGDRVSAGTQLGKVGNTGDSTGAHLHVQMEKNGIKIDPEPIIRALASSESKSSSSSGKYTGQYSSEINKAANRYGVDPFLIAAIIQQESGFNKNARSSAGAQGLMQLMPATARSLGVKNAYNAEENIMGGTKYISQMIKQFGNLETALAAYNAGPGNVNKYGGIPPFKETQNYVKKVMDNYNKSGSSGNSGSIVGVSSANTSRSDAEIKQAIDDAKIDLNELNMAEQDYLDAISELNMALVQSYLAEFDHRKSELEDDFAKLDRDQAKVPENSPQWMKLQLEREKLMQKEMKIQKESIAWLKKEIKNNKDLNEAQKALLTDELTSRTAALYNMEQEIYNTRLEMAEKAVEAYKSALEAQKKVAVEAIDKMISEIDKIAEEADYAENLRKAQKDRQAILDEMDKLALDGSDSARKRMSELAEDLNEADEGINDMIEENTRNKRKENLQEERDKTEQMYDDLLNDEGTFDKIRTDVINGKTNEITKALSNIFKSIQNETDTLGKSVINSLKSTIDTVNTYLKGVKTNNKKGSFKNTAPKLNANTNVKPVSTTTSPVITSNNTLSEALKNIANDLASTFKVSPLSAPVSTNNSTSNNFSLSLHVDGNAMITDSDARRIGNIVLGEIEKNVNILGGKL